MADELCEAIQTREDSVVLELVMFMATLALAMAKDAKGNVFFIYFQSRGRPQPAHLSESFQPL